MRKVFIPINSNIPLYKQFPSDNYVWGDYEFVLGGNCEDADYVVVLDSTPESIKVTCKEGGLVLFPMETKSIKRYSINYLRQFDVSFCFQDYLIKLPISKKSIPPFPWMLIYDFYAENDSVYRNYDYYNFKEPKEERLNKFCLFTSNKMFSKGHCDRLHFAESIKKALPDYVDIYGSGFQEVDVKYDVMTKYKYSIVIENDSVPNYRTEKLADSILAGCYSLYYGDPNIVSLLSKDEFEFIDIFDIEKSIKRIKTIISEDHYNKYSNYIKQTRNKVLYDWNTFSIITNCLNQVCIGEKRVQHTIYPYKPSFLFSLRNIVRRNIYKNLPYNIVRFINI